MNDGANTQQATNINTQRKGKELPFSRTTWVGRYQKDKPFWILLKQDMMGWKWHQLNHMQIICNLLQTDNHASTSSLHIFTGQIPFCHPTNSVKSTEGTLNGISMQSKYRKTTASMTKVQYHTQQVGSRTRNNTHQYEISHAANNCTTCCWTVQISTLCPINSKCVDKSGATVGDSFHATFGTFGRSM